MTPLRFRQVLEDRINKIRTVLDSKAGEYARGNDRLHNFKRVAEIKRITPEAACIDGFCKHLVSILDTVDDIGIGTYAPIPLWEEKIGDAVNYLILLEALVKERVETRKIMAGGGCPDEPIKEGMEGL